MVPLTIKASLNFFLNNFLTQHQKYCIIFQTNTQAPPPSPKNGETRATGSRARMTGEKQWDSVAEK